MTVEDSSDETEQVHNPDGKCWTANCQSEWTVVMEKTEINRCFGYCEEHAEMWSGGGHNFERVRTVGTDTGRSGGEDGAE